MQQGKQQPQHHPADGPAFWNITTNFKPGELESGLSTMFFNQAIDLQKENEALKAHIKHLEDIINRAHLAFFSDSSDRKVSIAMHRILDEEVRKDSQ